MFSALEMTGKGKSAAEQHLGAYLSEWTTREIQLSRLHEEIISRREALLNCSAAYHHSQEQRNRQDVCSSEQAYVRNHRLLQDIRSAKEKIYDELNSSPTPRFMTLQKNYWAMVRSQVQMWEQDLGIQRSRFKGREKSKSPDRKSQASQQKQRLNKKQRKSQQKK